MAADVLGNCFLCYTDSMAVYWTLFIHFVINALLLITTIGDVIGESPSFAWTGLSMPYQIALGSYALAGLPFIARGFYGVYHRMESTVRIYWFFLIACYIAELIWVAYSFIAQGPCRNVQTNNIGMPKAFGCGFLRGINIISIVFLVLVPLRFIMLLGSFVRDISLGVQCGVLGDLIETRDMKKHKSYYEREFDDDFACVHEQVGLLSAQGDGIVGRQIFGGTVHDTEYPPSRSWA